MNMIHYRSTTHFSVVKLAFKKPLAVIFCYLMHWHSDILKCGLSVQMLFRATDSFVSSMLAQKWIRLLCCTPGVLWLWLWYMRLLYYSVLLNFKWTLFLTSIVIRICSASHLSFWDCFRYGDLWSVLQRLL